MNKFHEFPILLYHDFKPDLDSLSAIDINTRKYILRNSDFINQMQWLYENNYKAVNLSTLVDSLKHNFLVNGVDVSPEKTLVLAFDDGLKSNYDFVLPVLKRYSFKAIFFVTAGLVGTNGMMNWNELQILLSEGMEIGSHSLTHPYPTELTLSALSFELIKSKFILEERLRTPISFFSSPTGFYNKKIRDIAKRAGYKAICFSCVDLNRKNDTFQLKKIGIKRDQSIKDFKRIVQRDKFFLYRLRSKQLLRDLAKIFLRRRLYEKIKSVVLRDTL